MAETGFSPYVGLIAIRPGKPGLADITDADWFAASGELIADAADTKVRG